MKAGAAERPRPLVLLGSIGKRLALNVLMLAANSSIPLSRPVRRALCAEGTSFDSGISRMIVVMVALHWQYHRAFPRQAGWAAESGRQARRGRRSASGRGSRDCVRHGPGLERSGGRAARALRTGAAGLQASDAHPVPSGKDQSGTVRTAAAIEAMLSRSSHVLKTGESDNEAALCQKAGRW